MSFLDALNSNIARFPNKVALNFLGPPSRQVTYGELGRLVGSTAAYLRGLGVSAGDRVALQLPKSLEFILLNLGTLSLGAISLPLNPAYPADELAFFLRDSGARLYFGSVPARDDLASKAAELPDLRHALVADGSAESDFPPRFIDHDDFAVGPRRIQPDETAVLVYTSGTTGRPKGAEITHGNLAAMLSALHTAWEWQTDDVLLHVLPIFHIHGLFVALYGALQAGATTLLMESFDATRTLDLLADQACSVFMGVPTTHKRLLDCAGERRIDLSHMRLMTSGSDRLPDAVFDSYRRTFQYALVERYGMTETGINCSNPVHGERRVGSVGPALPTVEVRVVDAENGEAVAQGEVGQVQVRGPSVFKGYWRQAEPTAAAFTDDGWFRTGDLGLLEADGYLTLRGRSRDLIISGGMNVYPPEVERVLLEHPAVQAAAVIGCTDAEWGERVVALVVCNSGTSITEGDLISFCRERLAPYKSPKAVLFRSDLPRNAMGKVQKAVLREEVCGGGVG